MSLSNRDWGVAMTAPDWKYTDSDVRARPDLMAAAVRYAKDYTGDWDFLVKAKLYADETNSLPVGVARGVLNCMRHDIAVVNSMPKPHRNVGGRVISFADALERRPKRRGLTLTSTFKVLYAFSPRQGIQVYHYLSPEKSEVSWVPDWDAPSGGKLHVKVRAVCSTYSYLVAVKEPPGGLRLCATCRSYVDRRTN